MSGLFQFLLQSVFIWIGGDGALAPSPPAYQRAEQIDAFRIDTRVINGTEKER